MRKTSNPAEILNQLRADIIKTLNRREVLLKLKMEWTVACVVLILII